MNNRISGNSTFHEAEILISLFVLVESLLILDAIFFGFLRKYGLLVTLSIMPCIYLVYWSIRSKSRELRFSAFLGFTIIFFIYFLLFWNCHDPILGFGCISEYFNNESDNYLPPQLVLILSLLYGLICIVSCSLGLRIERKCILDKNFPEATKNLIFVSIGVAIYLFIIERIIKGEYFEFDPFMIGFLSIIIAISSLYVIFGYFSQDKDGSVVPIVFFVYAFLSFAVGSTFSILILEFTKNVKNTAIPPVHVIPYTSATSVTHAILPTHWVFLCIWTLFVAGTIFALSRDISGISTFVKEILNNGLKKVSRCFLCLIIVSFLCYIILTLYFQSLLGFLVTIIVFAGLVIIMWPLCIFKKEDSEQENGIFWENHRDFCIYLISLVPAATSFSVISWLGFFTNTDDVHYMLSALVQCEAAVIAIFLTLGFVGLQLAGVYSPAIARVFRTSTGFKTLVFLYALAIFFGLCLLGILEQDLEVYIRISFSFGIFCLVALLLYAFSIIEMTEPYRFVEKQSQKINKRNLLKKEDPVQSIFDIIRALIRKHDEKTAIDGLNRIRDKIIYMFKNEKFQQREEIEISKRIYSNLKEVGFLALDLGNENVVYEILDNIVKTSKTAVEKNLDTMARRAVESLGVIGETIIRTKSLDDDNANLTAQNLEEITLCTMEKGFVAAKVAVRKLGIMGEAAIDKRLEYTTHHVVELLEEIAEAAGNEKQGVEQGKPSNQVKVQLGEVIAGAVEFTARIAKIALTNGFTSIAEQAMGNLQRMSNFIPKIGSKYRINQIRVFVEEIKEIAKAKRNQGILSNLKCILEKFNSISEIEGDSA